MGVRGRAYARFSGGGDLSQKKIPRNVPHAGIVRIKAAYPEDDDTMALVMEYMNGDLDGRQLQRPQVVVSVVRCVRVALLLLLLTIPCWHTCCTDRHEAAAVCTGLHALHPASCAL